jgi:hypothetical protein
MVISIGGVAVQSVGENVPMLNRGSEWSWDVDAESRVSSVKLSGVVTVTDVLAAQHDLAAHCRFDPSFALILDLSLASDLLLTFDDTRTIVARSPIALRAPRAIVANTVVSAAMAHAFRAARVDLTGTDVVRVCRSVLEAQRWLAARPDGLRLPDR